ncbi:MAG: bifunctional serine/threonine-protein kinase/formylglycine-generating enzyme family protein [bacterium]
MFDDDDVISSSPDESSEAAAPLPPAARGVEPTLRPAAPLSPPEDSQPPSPGEPPVDPVARRPAPTAGGGPEEPGGWRIEAGQLVDGRYRVERTIALGGFGEVYAVTDLRVGRPMAAKATPLARAVPVTDKQQQDAVQRRLRHPHILPTSDRFTEGQYAWLVMEAVDGGTLDDVIAALHPDEHRQRPATTAPPAATGPARERARSAVNAPSAPSTPWSFEQAMWLLVGAARAVGAAHAAGVVHLDLKPDNIMFERRDRSPRVIDWELARCLDTVAAERPGRPPGAAPFMAPERLAGEAVDARADVYALGAVMYTLWTGRMPFQSSRVEQIEAAWRAGATLPPPALPADGTDWSACRAACTAALSPDPAARPADGAAFADALESALVRRAVARAGRWRAAADARLAEAAALQRRADGLLDTLSLWDPVKVRAPGWRDEDRARELAEEADEYLANWEEEVRAISYWHPAVPEPHAALARYHLGQFLAAERAGDRPATRRLRAALRGDGERLRATVARATSAEPGEVLAELAALNESHGALDVLSAPPGAQVEVARLTLEDRMWRPGPFRAAGVTPLTEAREPWGPIVARLTAPGRAPAQVPMVVTRGAKLPTPDPEGRVRPIVLPKASLVGPDDVYIPAGWFRAGGSRYAIDGVAARSLWVDGFLIKRDPVTHREYIRFLDALAAAGRLDELAALRPALLEPHAPDKLRPLYDLIDGRHVPVERDRHLDEPVSRIDWASARAYAAWYAAETGRPWRLMSEWEYEKAARGVDGRRLPWGDHFEPVLTHVANSLPQIRGPVPVATATADVSIYGVRWLAGNMRSWCLEPWALDGPPDGSRVVIADIDVEGPADTRMVRGGAFCSTGTTVDCAARFGNPPGQRLTTVGLRLACDLAMEGDDGIDAE